MQGQTIADIKVMQAFRRIYKIVRSVVFTTLLLIVCLYALLYAGLAIPSVQNRIRIIAEKELSSFLKGDVRIGRLDIVPFSEVRMTDISIAPTGEAPCLEIVRLGVGIDLFELAFHGRVDLSYAEISGMKANIYKKEESGKLNIDFIIQALKPKHPGQPPSKILLTLRKASIRNASFKYANLWKSEGKKGTFDPNYIYISDFSADIRIPELTEERYDFEISRLGFTLQPGFKVESLNFHAVINQTTACIKGFALKLPHSQIFLDDMNLSYPSLDKIGSALKTDNLKVGINNTIISPADFSFFVPGLLRFEDRVELNLLAEGNPYKLCSVSGDIKLPDYATSISLDAETDSPMDTEKMRIAVKSFQLNSTSHGLSSILSKVDSNLSSVVTIPGEAGNLTVSSKGEVNMESKSGYVEARLNSGLGSLDINASKDRNYKINVSSPGFNLHPFIRSAQLGKVVFNAEAEFDISKPWPIGYADINFDGIELNGADLHDIVLEVNASESEINIHARGMDTRADFVLDSNFGIDGPDFAQAWKQGDLTLDIMSLKTSLLASRDPLGIETLSGKIDVSYYGESLREIEAELKCSDLKADRGEEETLHLNSLVSSLRRDEDGRRNLNVYSDWLEMDMSVSESGAEESQLFDFRGLADAASDLLARTMPILGLSESERDSEISADFELKADAPSEVFRFFKLPVIPLGPLKASGSLDAKAGKGNFLAEIPFLQQGKNLIRDTHISASLDRESGTLNGRMKTIYPTKKGLLNLDAIIEGIRGDLYTDLEFAPIDGALMTGNLSFATALKRNSFTNKLETNVEITPSVLTIAGEDWHFGAGTLKWSDGKGTVSHINLHHGEQYIDIDGIASKDTSDKISIKLGGINLEYVFGILNINYVTFGGVASGEIVGEGVLGNERDVTTKFFNVQDFSYNNCILGDAAMKVWLDSPQMMIGINADIREGDRPCAEIGGGIWATRDSLSFEMDTHKINAGFIGPFMAAFADDVKGRASGKVKLFGTFSDIDLIGRVKAEDLSLRLLSTNVVYTANDSVIMTSGHIALNNFKVTDRNGNSAMLNGWVGHTYFHEPTFDFRMTDAKNILCYDTNQDFNPLWYGSIYGTGSGHMVGRPGFIAIDIDIASERNSSFTFVVSEKEEAGEYDFLTFTDKRKASMVVETADTVPEFLKQFDRQVQTEDESPETEILLDIRASVTPGVLVTLVMDEKAGDKITSRGGGTLQMTYDSGSEELKMFGKYVLEEGTYNFSLQDIILKNFRIKEGSSIAFNGDPLAAELDISATYRVNANLADLDRSFAEDKDLNRTNVPVDAVLKVSGDLNSPDINFDVELPTVTTDVERKVKSLMSTEDLLSRQIIYLLAMNRFYTPEYANMGESSSSGAELTSVASSTISSQLANMLSQLTDRVSLAPSFRSDKGDFSDVEVDLGLSSRLLDNRLLINGNFGYRDRATSTQSTQFIGDFDIEYLLSRSGNLRLKAYNRFNDQNYYLRQALTTQGVGIVFRKDFDRLFPFLRRSNKKKEEVPADSITGKEKE